MAKNEWSGWKLCSVAAALMFVFPPAATLTEKINARIDIVVVLQHAHTVNPQKYEIAAYKKFAESFEVGQGKARFGIAFYTHISIQTDNASHPVKWKILDMTSDANLYNQKLDSFTVPSEWMGPHQKWTAADPIEILGHIMKDVFRPIRKNDTAMAIFYIVTDSPGDARDPTISAFMAQLSDLGVWLYVYVPNRNDETDNSLRVAKAIAKPHRIFLSTGPQYDQGLVDDVAKRVKHTVMFDLCQWDSACRYKNEHGNFCEFEAWRPSTDRYVIISGQCDDMEVKPSPISCPTPRDCFKECEKRWPWEPTDRPNCTGLCGKTACVERPGDPPDRMEYCVPWIDCPPCAERMEAKPDDADGIPIYVIILIVVGILVASIICMIIIVLVARKRKKKKKPPPVQMAAVVSRGSSITPKTGSGKSAGSSKSSKLGTAKSVRGSSITPKTGSGKSAGSLKSSKLKTAKSVGSPASKKLASVGSAASPGLSTKASMKSSSSKKAAGGKVGLPEKSGRASIKADQPTAGKASKSVGAGKSAKSTGPGKSAKSVGPGKSAKSIGTGKSTTSTGPGKSAKSTGPGKSAKSGTKVGSSKREGSKTKGPTAKKETSSKKQPVPKKEGFKKGLSAKKK